jgi:hypothetical protein
MKTASGHVRDVHADPGSVMRLVEISAGYWLPRALQVVANLGVADALDDEPQPVTFLAERCGANPDALDRVLRLLASQGIFDRRGGSYAHNALSRALRSDHPQSMRAYVRLLGLPVFWQSWGELGQVVRTSKPGIDDIFAYFRDHPEESEIFNAGMKAKSQSAIFPVIAAYDFSGFGAIGDIGGGQGHLLRAILREAQTSRGVLFDQPHVIAQVDEGEAEGGRLSLQGGDFFRGPLPRCDAYVLMEVLHDWPDEQARRILQQIRKSAPPAAKVLIVETVLPDETAWEEGKGAHFGHHLDINMLVLTGGRERTIEDCKRLFALSGWRFTRAIGTASPYSIVEGVAT